MEMEMQSYEIYIDTPENRFEYDPESIWFINPKTKKWVLELKKSGHLWYYTELYNNFSMWFKEEKVVFQQLITIWVEDVLKRGVSTTTPPAGSSARVVEDVLKRGVSTTLQPLLRSTQAVEDVLKNGVSLNTIT